MKSLHQLLFSLSFALCVFSFSSFGAEVKEDAKYIASVFEKPSSGNLLIEDLALLDSKSFFNISFDQLSLNILINDVYLSNLNSAKYIGQFVPPIVYHALILDKTALLNIYETETYLALLNGNYLKAADFLKKAFYISRADTIKNQIYNISKNLSYVNILLGNKQEASLYADTALANTIYPKDSRKYLNDLIWQNKMKLSAGNNERAEQQILQVILPNHYKGNAKFKEWTCYYHLGEIYLKQRKMIQAKWFFVQALSLGHKLHQNIFQIKALIMLAKVKVMVDDADLAIADLKIAQKTAEAKYPLFIMDIAKGFSEAYRSIKNTKKANEYNLIYNELKKEYFKK